MSDRPMTTIEQLQKEIAEATKDKGGKNKGKPVDPTKVAHAEALLASLAPGSKEYDKALLVNTLSPGEGLKGKDVVRLPENLLNKYRTFLDKLCTAVTRARTDPATGQLKGLDSTNFGKSSQFESLKYVYEFITYTNGEIRADKLNNLLNEEKGILLVQEMMDDHIRMIFFGMGLSVSAQGGGTIDARVTGKKKTGLNQGGWNKNWDKLLAPFQKIGGAPWREGLIIDRDACAEALASIKNSPTVDAQKAYMKSILGIDLEDYDYDLRNGNIEVKANRSLDPNILAKEAAELVFARQMFYESLGIDGKDVDALLEQGLTDTAGQKKKKQRKIDGKGSPNPGIGATVLSKGYIGLVPPEAFENTRGASKSRIMTIYDETVARASAPGGQIEVAIAARDPQKVKILKIQFLADARLQYMRELTNAISMKETIKAREKQAKEMSDGIAAKIADRAPGKEASGGKDAKNPGRLIEKAEGVFTEKIRKIDADISVIEGDGAPDRKGLRNGLDKISGVDKEKNEAEAKINEKITALNLDKKLTTLGATAQPDRESKTLELLTTMLSVKQDKVLDDPLTIDNLPLGVNSFPYEREQVITKATQEIGNARNKLTTPKTELDAAKRAKFTADAVVRGQEVNNQSAETKIAGFRTQVENLVTIEKTKLGKSQGLDVYKEGLRLQQEISSEIKKLVDLTQSIRDVASAASDLDQKQGDYDLAVSVFKAEEGVINERKKIELEEIDFDAAGTQKEKEALEALIKARDDAKAAAEARQKTDPELAAARQTVSELARRYGELKGYHDGANPKKPYLTDADLCDKTIEEIMAEINKAHAVTPAQNENQTAWPEAENSSPERRRIVLLAKIQAQADRLATANNKGNPITPTPEDKLEVMRIFVEQQKVVKIGLEAQKKKVPEDATLKNERDILERAQKLINWKNETGASYEVAEQLIQGAADDSKCVDVCASCTIAPLTAEEKMCLESGGYLLFLHALTGYMNISDLAERGKAFNSWKGVFDEKMIAGMLKNYLGLPSITAIDTPQARTAVYKSLNTAAKGGQGLIRDIKAEAYKLHTEILQVKINEQVEIASAIA